MEAVAARLDEAGAAWCMLRGDGARGRDVDLLADRRHSGEVDAAMTAAGFARLRTWGRQRFYLAHDEERNGWVAVHLAVDLAFGPRFELLLGGGPRVLGRAGPGLRGLPTVHPSDEFWILILHALLDKRSLAEKHRRRLAVLAADAGPTDELARRLAAVAGRSWPARLHELALDGQWDALETAGTALRRNWWRGRAVKSLGNRLRNSATLALRKVSESFTARGPSVALLGPDGAGKSTLAQSLADGYVFGGRVIYLGLYSARERVLELPIPGVRGAQRLLRLAWRSAIARYHTARRRLVVFDRHPYDVEATGRGSRRTLRRRVLAHAGPSPDVVIVLDAPTAVLHARTPEHGVERLEEMRRGYLALARRLPNAVVVDATDPPAIVAARAMSAVWATRLVSAARRLR